jgi:adenosine deaminase
MRHETLLQLAGRAGIQVPTALDGTHSFSPGSWRRFQATYDAARSAVRDEAALQQLVTELAEDARDDGAGWVEVQVTPPGYAARFGGIVAFTEFLLDACTRATASVGVGLGVVIAANRTRPPWEAMTLARLAARYAGRGVVGFGLSNDERQGRSGDFARAFALARDAGLLSVPHAGELLGPASVRHAVDILGAHRIGHGVRAAESKSTMRLLAERGIVLEVCPSSNVALRVAPHAAAVPLRVLRTAGVRFTLGADDPLIFGPGSSLLGQYQIARSVHGFDDFELAEVAATGIRACAAPSALRTSLLDRVQGWLAEAPAA